MTAPLQGLSDADALLAQSDADFAKTFGLPVPAEAPAAPAAPEPAPPAEPAAPAEPDTQARDEKGRFVAKADAPPEPSATEPPPTADAPKAEAPKAETPPAQPPAPAKPKPITDFKVFDGDGDEVELPTIEVEFKGNKQVQRLSLDRVVRLAQTGAYNAALQQEVETARSQVPQLERVLASLRDDLAAQQALNRRLLGDEQFYAQSVEAFQKTQTPEARAERAERTVREYQDRERGQQAQGHAIAFLPKLERSLQTIIDTSPEVSFEELWGRFTLRTADMLVRGVIPPERYSEVEALVASDLRLWAQQVSDERAQQRTQQKNAADDAVQRAQEEAARTKQLLTRKLKPVGVPPEKQPSSPRPTKPPETVDEAVQSVLAEVGEVFGGKG